MVVPLAVRPSIGWLGYLAMGTSPARILFAMLIFTAACLQLMKHSKESSTLRFSNPVPGSASILIVPSPTDTSFNSFDACAVEAALPPPLESDGTKAANRNWGRTRPVLLYQWGSNVGPGDPWVKVVSKMKGVKVVYMNLVKSLINTPVEGMLTSGGWGSRPDWAIRLAAGSSLLWKAGGLLMSTGILMTKHMKIEAFGNNSGLLVATEDSMVHPVLIGTPPNHPFVKQILEDVENFDFDFYGSLDDYDTESLAGLLVTRSARKACQVSAVNGGTLAESDECHRFKVIEESQVVRVGITKHAFVDEDAVSFLKLSSERDVFKYNLAASQTFFRRHGLVKFCPKVYKFMELEAKNYL